MSLCSTGLEEHVGELPERRAEGRGAGLGPGSRGGDGRLGAGKFGRLPEDHLSGSRGRRDPGAGEPRVQVRSATRAPGVLGARGSVRQVRAEGLRPPRLLSSRPFFALRRSRARPFSAAGVVCLRAPADRSRVRGWGRALQPRCVPHARHHSRDRRARTRRPGHHSAA